MRHWCGYLAFVACLLLVGNATAQGPGLSAATGLVEKTGKNSLTIRPRGHDGKFAKSVLLKLTGTSKLTTLSQQKRGSRVTVVQREADLKDLKKNQSIAVIYTTGRGGAILLSGVVLPPK